jgi:beta-lactamase regulating signal transducer with metallopeptidase domain
MKIFSSPLLGILAEALVKGTLLLMLAFGFHVLFRKSSAAIRYFIWFCALTGGVAFLVFGGMKPLLPLPILPEPLPLEAPEFPVEETSLGEDAKLSHSNSNLGWFSENSAYFILGVWGMGTIAILAFAVLGLFQIARMTRRAQPVHDGELQHLVATLALEMGMRRPIRLFESEACLTPFTWGIFHPVILLPADYRDWSWNRMYVVLIHELAHIKRWDFLTQWFIRITSAIYWLNPLVWFAVRRLKLEREQACDDYVLGHGVKPSEYSIHLLEMVQRLRNSSRMTLGLAMARPHQLETRLQGILDFRRNRQTMSPSGLITGCVFLGVFLLAMVVTRPVEKAHVVQFMAEDSRQVISTPSSGAFVPPVRRRIGGSPKELTTNSNLYVFQGIIQRGNQLLARIRNSLTQKEYFLAPGEGADSLFVQEIYVAGQRPYVRITVGGDGLQLPLASPENESSTLIPSPLSPENSGSAPLHRPTRRRIVSTLQG